MGHNTRTMAIALIVWAIGEGLWLYLQPIYVSRLGATPEQIGIILAMSGLARLFVMVPAGLLADRYGARQMMIPGWLLGMLGTVVIAAAPNLYVAAAGFLIYGASAMAIPVINVYLVQSIEADQTVTIRLRPQEVLTFIHALFWFGVIVSPTIGGILAEYTSIRLVFWLSAVWFLLSTIIVLRTQAYEPPARQSGNLRTLLAPYADFLSQTKFRWLYLIFTLGFVATILGFTFAPKYLNDVRDLSESRIGLLGSVLAIGSFSWNLFIGGRRPWISFLLALAITALSFILIISSGQFLILVVAYFLMGIWEVLRPVSTSIVAEYSHPKRHGVAFGLVDTLHGLGMFLAPSVAGILYARAAAWPFLVAVSLVPVAYGVVWLFVRRGFVIVTPSPTSSPEPVN